jgi:zinc protease
MALAILVSVAAADLRSQPAAVPPPVDLQAFLPLDRAVRTGTLANGMTFFIRQNSRPAGRLVLRLAVKAGSLQEADDQQGLAHFVEHMAFNGNRFGRGRRPPTRQTGR